MHKMFVVSRESDINILCLKNELQMPFWKVCEYGRQCKFALLLHNIVYILVPENERICFEVSPSCNSLAIEGLSRLLPKSFAIFEA